MNTQPVLSYRIARPLAEAEADLRAALQAKGFGILTEVDVAATLRQKLGIETKPHRILGACNPRLAHASISAEANVAAFLPCGIAVREGETPDETLVAVQNPALIAEAFAAPELPALAQEVLGLIDAALLAVGSRT